MKYFENDKCRLVAISEQYLNNILNWINDERINNSSGPRFPVSIEGQKRWLEGTIQSSNKEKLVILSKDDAAVGLVSMMNIDFKNRNSEVGVYIDPVYMGNGYAYMALSMLLRFAFLEMNMYKIYANIHEDNIASVKLFEKLKFSLESNNVKSIYKNGQYIDVLKYSIFNGTE